jgi:hypothetical protein
VRASASALAALGAVCVAGFARGAALVGAELAVPVGVVTLEDLLAMLLVPGVFRIARRSALVAGDRPVAVRIVPVEPALARLLPLAGPATSRGIDLVARQPPIAVGVVVEPVRGRVVRQRGQRRPEQSQGEEHGERA